jgi:arylsulfatase A-like enzyme
MAPYVFIRNDRFTMRPTLQQQGVPFPHFVRNGPRSADFEIDQVLDKLIEESVEFIQRAADADKPFFLYLPLTAPHKPTQPHARFRGKTQLGEYGDFVAQVDWSVGQVLQAIDDAGVGGRTLVVYASDNGSYMHRYDHASRKDHVDDSTVQGFRAEHHRANGPFRGTKADIWEAGHHIPLLVRWPGEVEPQSVCIEPVCLTDLFATVADVVGVKLDNDVAEDSFSLLPMLRGEVVRRGAPVVHHSVGGMFAIRDGDWKLIAGNGSGGRENPKGKPFAEPYQLYDVASDIAESVNVADKHQDVVRRLTRMLDEIRSNGRSVNREPEN